MLRHTHLHTLKTQKNSPTKIETIIYKQKICKFKNIQIKHYRQKKPPEVLLSSFCVDHLLLRWGLLIIRFLYPMRLHQQKLMFLLGVIINWRWLLCQGWGAISSLSVLKPHLGQTHAGPMDAATVSISSYMHWFCCMQKAWFPWYPSSPVTLSLFGFLFL